MSKGSYTGNCHVTQITPNIILTAGHCLKDDDRYDVFEDWKACFPKPADSSDGSSYKGDICGHINICYHGKDGVESSSSQTITGVDLALCLQTEWVGSYSNYDYGRMIPSPQWLKDFFHFRDLTSPNPIIVNEKLALAKSYPSDGLDSFVLGFEHINKDGDFVLYTDESIGRPSQAPFAFLRGRSTQQGTVSVFYMDEAGQFLTKGDSGAIVASVAQENINGVSHRVLTLQGVISKRNPINDNLQVTPLYPFHDWILACSQHLKYLDHIRTTFPQSYQFHNDKNFAYWVRDQDAILQAKGEVNPCMEKINSKELKNYKKDPIALDLQVFPNPSRQGEGSVQLKITDRYIKTIDQVRFLEDIGPGFAPIQENLGSTCQQFNVQVFNLSGQLIEEQFFEKSSINQYQLDKGKIPTGHHLIRVKGLKCGSDHNQSSIRGISRPLQVI